MGDIRDVIKKVLSESKSKETKKWAKPVSSFKMTFDSQQAQLEPIYYWLLDFVQDMGWDMEKLTDNFTASPGSGQFSEMSMKATKMQEEGMKILGGLNQVVKSVLNLVYDLKEFELRLAHYDDANSNDDKKKEEGLLALKQIWLDNVDLKRGRGSIHQMAAELGFTTLREAFMIANSQEELKEMNKGKDGEGGLVNDSVYRVLIPRLSEFLKWADYSEKELRKRFSIEKNYLKSQVETIKLYSAWMKPYLKAAEDLRQRGFDKNVALVNAFSTSMFELQIFGKQPMKVPEKFHGYKLKRDYNQCIVIGLKYRGHVSQRVTQKGDMGFGMGGRVDMTFDAYALNDEEYNLVRKELDKADVDDSMVFSADVAGEALADLKEDLDYFLKSDEEKAKIEAAEKKKTGEGQDINPFSALFGLFKGGAEKVKGEKKEIESVKDIKSDNYVERVVRAEAAAAAAGNLHTVYDIYKKAHGMASAPGEGFNRLELDEGNVEEAKVGGKVGFWGAFKGRGS
ncbi:MAG: hypothetical protein KKF50_00615 [Nanoarchaeota archaeon]|nr:hypothetical protein [Nanoarchaeota archaeon]